MKLERYVLLDDSRIIDTNNSYQDCPKHWNTKTDTDICYVEMGKNGQLFDNLNLVLVIDTTQLKKTSNSILDLVEVGDLVEKLCGTPIYVDNQVYAQLQDYIAIGVKAFYKKQPNGDYKRYGING